MGIPHVSTGPASSSAQNDLIDEVNALRALIETPDPFVLKTGTDSATSNSFINDGELFLTLAEGLWEVSAFLSATGIAAADLKTTWALSGGAAQATARHCRGPSLATTAVDATTMRSQVHNWSSSASYGLDGSGIAAVSEIGIVTITGTGTLQLQFAQQTTNATATNITNHSWIHARRVG